MTTPGHEHDAAVRNPAVAGVFYPADPPRLRRMAAAMLAAATPHITDRPGSPFRSPIGLLVPHAGLAYSGQVAATGWRLVLDGTTVVILGTNHTAAWLRDVGAWESGSWRTPLGDVAVDADLASEILALGPPFGPDRAAHLGEHSIEVQLPLLHAVAPSARIVPLAVGAGTGAHAVEAGIRLGTLLARRRAAGASIILAISTDMAHYPPADACVSATMALLPSLEGLRPNDLAAAEASIGRGTGSSPGMVCGMCGIEPAVLGLAALRAMGAKSGITLASATSADAGADPGRAVGYLAMAFGD